MSSQIQKAVRLVKVLVLVGLVGWGLFAWWTIRQARRAGAVVGDTLTAAWPEKGGPRFGTRDKLFTAAENIENGDFASVVSDLGPTQPPSAQAKAIAQRFFAQAQHLRKRFIAAASTAQALQEDGADVSTIRNALARALTAATKKDRDAVITHVQWAEAALERIGLGEEVAAAGNDAEAVKRLVAGIGPAFELNRDLMTEGHAAVEKLVQRASRCYQAGQFRQAASLLNLAGQLLGVQPLAVADIGLPKWFEGVASSPSTSVTKPEAEAVVTLCDAVAASETPSPPVTTLIKKARRELDAGRFAEARWWASVGLNSLGMTDEAITAATEIREEEAPQ